MTAYNELTNFDISGKNILIREDLNVPVYNNQIVNDARILAAIPTIKYALSNGAKVAIISHFGRPKEGIFDKKYSLKIIAKRLSEILEKKVYFEDTPLDVKSPEYKNDITLYENTRFLLGEKTGDDNLAKKIIKNCDVFVMDAWGKSQDADGKVMMLADGNGEFTSAIGLELDASGFGMGTRGQRFSLVINDGEVEIVNIEDGGEFRVSSCDYMIDQL